MRWHFIVIAIRLDEQLIDNNLEQLLLYSHPKYPYNMSSASASDLDAYYAAVLKLVDECGAVRACENYR